MGPCLGNDVGMSAQSTYRIYVTCRLCDKWLFLPGYIISLPFPIFIAFPLQLESYVGLLIIGVKVGQGSDATLVSLQSVALGPDIKHLGELQDSITHFRYMWCDTVSSNVRLVSFSPLLGP